MKKRVFTIVSMVVVAILYYFSISGLKGAENTNLSVSSIIKDSIFTNCIFNSPYSDIISWMKPQLNVNQNIDRYEELNFNSIQWYDGGSDRYGYPDQTLNQSQIDSFKGVLNSVRDGNLLGFYERSHLGKYAYGQRLIYEVSPMNDGYEVNNGFVYLYNMPETYDIDSGRTVNHLKPGVQDPGYLCKNIYENLQHSDLFDFRQNDTGKWFIKPVMRIPDSMPPSKKVVRIDVISFNGVWVDSIIITADNFNDDNGSYSGNYLEKYFRLPQNEHNLQISGQDTSTGLNYGHHERWWNWDDSCKVDFRVFWYGECEIWFDKMIVDDEVANDLFDPAKQLSYINPRIQQEVQSFTGTEGNNSFFIDEILMSQYPCIQYIAKKMRDYEPESKLSIAVTNYLHIHGLKNDGLSYQVYLDSIKPNFMQADHHGFSDAEPMIPDVFPNPDTKIPSGWFESNMSKYNSTLQNKVFGSSTDVVSNDEIGSLIYEIKKTKDNINQFSPNTNFIMQPQLHGWIFTNDISNNYVWGLREPTNEEIQAQAMLSIAHGADGLCWFIYNSHTWDIDSDGTAEKYMLGLLNPVNDTAKRISNDYEQDKWTYISAMNGKIKNWLPVLENTNWAEGYSVHNQGAGNKYIKDIKSIYRNASNQFVDDPSCTNCDNIKYWEAGYLVPGDQTDKSKYFLMVNRRCVPETTPGVGDIRQLKIKFDSTQLTGFKNWIIKDINTGSNITFNKNNLGSDGYLNLGSDTASLGYFLPGEGKLFKLAPVMQEGGTLVCDEVVATSTFTCNGTVFNNGYDLTISSYTTITFSNDAGIEMNGGSFECGEYSTEDNQVTFNGSDSSKGLVLSNLSSIGIYNTTLNNLKNDSSETAILISNTYDINMKGCIFNAAANSGGINISFTIDPPDTLSLNISECTFLTGSSGCDAVSISSNGSPSAAVLIDWCTFTTSNDSSNALRLINVTGGAVKNSTFVNFSTTISALGSAFDLYNNKILGKTNSTGIQCLSSSSLSMKPISGNYLGGYNYIKNYGTSSSCINVNNSYFDINYGENDFDLNDLDNSKFLTGTLSGDPCDNVDATKNCFHEDSTINVEANHSVTWYNNSDPVSFTFTGYSCELTPLENFFVLQYEGYNDTIYRSGGGEGGGFNPNKTLNTEKNTYKSLKDTVNINLRKRNYQTVETNAKTILSQYPDSLESIGMVQKLYMASLNLDSTKIGLTKTFLENLISNNTQNPSLIKRAFYFIQKCKVKLGQYQSALEGFQYIMTQNPYTYEGLVASWDYAATYLLMGTGGSIQGDNEQTVEDLNTPADTLLSRMSKRDINTNRNSNNSTNEKITKIFYEKIKNTTKDDRSKQEEKVKTLEKKLESSKSTTEKNEAARELAVMKQIKEAVKIKKPNTVMNHIQIMNDDIKKVFGVGKKSTKESTNSLIPQTYQLYQNYPNPFNPTTKIAFDLPKDAKVKLVIYDILGREIKTLVNNEFRSAGKYITEFNGSNMASGVYFARILVNEGKEFIAVKKMVLIK